MRRQKYHNRKVTLKGKTFDSRLEGMRWIVLKEAEESGRISNLRTQVSFELIPKQTIVETVSLKTRDKQVERVVERAVNYVADFVYEKDGATIVEDTKSHITRTPEYIIKRKLMRMQGHPITEIETATEGI